MINNNLVLYECFFFNFLIPRFNHSNTHIQVFTKKKGKFQTFAIGSNLLKKKDRNV